MVLTFLSGFKFNGGIHFVLWQLFLLHLIVVQVFATPNRCDVRKRVTHWTRCQECSLNALTRCPFPYIHTSGSEGVRGCPLRIYFGSTFGVVTVSGCQHTCDKMETYRECCPGFWGWDCQACPGNPVCSSAGKCYDKVSGNGTCSCQDGFQGTACEICTNSTMFGPGCNQTCTCERGVCDNSLNSTGDCKPYSCHTGYVGANCETRLPACNKDVHLSCAKNADCFNIKGVDTCICNPGYTGDGNTSCSAINPCKGHIKHGCHSEATCQYLGPGKHKCECKQGYRGDGRFCLVIDPCTSANNGGCPKNSSVCNFLGPGKSNCSCLHGFSNFSIGKGCSMIDMCKDGNLGGCDINANCVMVKPGEKRCNCKKGFRGNGTVCYGNIIERIQQLENSGPPRLKGHLKQINQILLQTMSRPLADTGPFTAFVAIDEAISSLSYDKRMQLNNNTDLASQIVGLHLVAADLDSFALKKLQNITTLQGADARVSEANGSLFYSPAHSSRKAKIIATDFLAGNGMIHIVDKMFWWNNYVDTADLTLLQVIGRTKEFSQFAAFLQLTGLDKYIRGLQGSLTFFVPVDSAFQFDQLTSDFLTKTNKGKEKLRSILKNHIVSKKFYITDLISLSRLKSDEGESNTIKRSKNGAIIIGDNAQITQSNILAKNGILHKINNLLIPDAVLPLVHNFANKTMNISARGVCYRCDTMPSFPNKGCPPTYKPSGGFQSCGYKLLTSLGQFTFRGCQMKYCLKAKQIAECNSGYYGSSCRPCPGQIEKPCNLHGKCHDRIKGTGVCKCEPLFTGFACEKCSNATMFGSSCNKTCTCVHGSCDNGIQGNGTCKPNSCQAGYHGDNCDITDQSCVGSPSLRCHYKARCVNDNGTDVCKCSSGYEGSGLECYEINPCAKPNRGGCHKDAKCTKTGPGTNVCTCDKGFTGDGLVCAAINPCEINPSCHSNAKCKFLGPGQSKCQCKAGFTGDGKSCVEINNCLINNGGCSKKATCSRTGPGKSHCACFNGYIGNGYSCLGSVTTILQDDRRFSQFFALIMKAHMEFFLSMEDKNFTVFAPSSKAIAALSKNDSDYWTSSPVKLKYLLQHHVINTTIFKRDFKNNSVLIPVAGQPLRVTITKSVTLNEQVSVTIPDNVGANGVIHGIDTVLVPTRLPETYSPSVMQALEGVKELSNFSNILAKQKDIKTKLDLCVGFYTIFAPVNDVLKSMSPKTLKYHIVTKYISPGHFFNGQEFPTMLSAANFKVKLTKSAKGKSEVNGVQFYDTQPIRTKCGIIYKLANLLSVPPQRHCDLTRKYLGITLCRMCFFQSNCPSGWTKLRTQGCYFWVVFRGCQAVCQKSVVIKKCCSGFWGQDCQACPGNVTSACSGNGKCNDGKTGSGHCECSSNFTGTSCEKCLPNRFGKQCTSKCDCVKGRCNEGPTGNGACKCFHGWHGPRCSDRADTMKCRPTVCHANATTRSITTWIIFLLQENLTTDYFVRSGGGVQFTTLQGQSIFISCKGDKGDLYVNGISRISKRDIHFKGGVAFVVDDIITPLGLGGKCDEVVHEKITGRCSSCLSPEGCPHESTLVGTTNYNCSYDNGFLGCQHICMKRKIHRKCCPNFYGSDCRACPGGLGMTCSRRGQCDDGLTGSGRCSCREGFNGTTCERCTVNSTCQVTSPCSVNNGGCHVFATCSNSTGHVKCKCKPGYEGDGFYCQMEDLCTVNNGGCGINATCHFKGPGQRRCQCKQGFHQVLDRCEGFVSSSPCAVNHGSCSDHAYCKDSNGTAACTCWESYIGNGYVCNGNILQTLQNTVKVQNFYKALYHLGNTNQGQSLFSSLQIDSNYVTVFAPINSALRIKDLNITLAKNFIISGRIVLSTINDVYTATNLLGTKIMIRKLNSGILTINGVAHVLGDMKATNGLIYIVDQVIPIVGQVPLIPTAPPSSTSPATTTAKPPSSSPSSSATTTSSSSSPSSLPPTSPSTTEAPRTSQTKFPSSIPTKPSTKPPRTSHTKFPSARPSSRTKEPTGTTNTKTSNSTAKPGVLGRHGKDKGVSGGAVAGIVITVLILIAIIAGVIWFLRKRALLPNSAFRYKKENDTVQYDSDVFQENPPSLSYNNPMYDVSEPGPDRIEVHGDKSLPPPFTEHTDFTNPIYELEERPPEEFTEGASGMLLFQDDEKPPGEEIC